MSLAYSNVGKVGEYLIERMLDQWEAEDLFVEKHAECNVKITYPKHKDDSLADDPVLFCENHHEAAPFTFDLVWKLKMRLKRLPSPPVDVNGVRG